MPYKTFKSGPKAAVAYSLLSDATLTTVEGVVPVTVI